MTPQEIFKHVDAWLRGRGRSGWTEAGGVRRLSLCAQWRDVTERWGADSNAATGTLLGLVREAFGEPSIYACSMGDRWIVTWRGAHGSIAEGDTELLAALAALEAAPC